MASIPLFLVATTGPTPRTSASVSYSGSGAALFTLNAPNWATDNPAITVLFAVQQSFDSGLTWSDVCSVTWNPGNWGKGGQPRMPSLQCTVGDVLGVRLLRAQLSATGPSTLQAGIDATVA